MDRATLLKAVSERPHNSRFGIATAASYLKAFDSCLDGGFCPRYAQNIPQERWRQVLKDAEQQFVYTAPGMNVKHVLDATDPQYAMEFTCVISTRRKDRDGDVLLPDGAILDPRAPLLWQHNPLLPIGRVLGKTKQDSQKIGGRCAIAKFDHDSELAALAKDAMTLIECGALRISHGFDPREIKALDEDDGRYLVPVYEILEVSTVSIPSNEGAIIESFSRGKLHSPIAKGWAEGIYRARPAQGVGFDPPKIIVHESAAGGEFTMAKPHDCTCHTKDAAAGYAGDSVRRDGESLQDCVSRKIGILVGEGKTQEQAAAIAYSICGEKAMADLGISRESLTPKETVMSTETKPAATAETKSPETIVGPVNTGVPSTDRMNSETQIPQMAQQGDSEWPGRHPSSMVRDESLVGVDDFDVGNTADDAIMAIAMGGMTGAQQNPSSPATDLSMRPGPMNQSGVPTPTSGVQFPMPMQGTYDPGVSPGPQGGRSEPSLINSVQGPKDATPVAKDANVNSGMVPYEQQVTANANVTQAVTPLDRDSAQAHGVAGTANTTVRVNNPPEINGLPNIGKDPLKRLLNVKGRLEFLFHKAALTHDQQKVLAGAYAGLMLFLKDYNLDPVGNGMSATLPANNVLDQHSLGNFTSIPGNNSLNSSSRTGWQGSTPPSPGLPAENVLNQPSMVGMGQPMQPNTPAANPPTGGKSTQGFIGTTPDEGVLNTPRTETQPAGQRVATDGIVHERRIDPNIRENVGDPNISGSLAYGYDVSGVRSNVLNENEVMDWLDAAGMPKAAEETVSKEFDELFTQEFEAKEFDEMFAK